MAQMDVHEVTHYCYQMLKAYAKLQRFKPVRDPRSWEVNCEVRRPSCHDLLFLSRSLKLLFLWQDDLVRHYDRGSMLKGRYLLQDNSSCLRPPTPGVPLSVSAGHATPTICTYYSAGR